MDKPSIVAAGRIALTHLKAFEINRLNHGLAKNPADKDAHAAEATASVMRAYDVLHTTIGRGEPAGAISADRACEVIAFGVAEFRRHMTGAREVAATSPDYSAGRVEAALATVTMTGQVALAAGLKAPDWDAIEAEIRTTVQTDRL